MTSCTHGDDWREDGGECEARGCTETLEDRRAVLCGPSAMAARRAQQYQQVRLAAAAREREDRLVKAIRRVGK